MTDASTAHNVRVAIVVLLCVFPLLFVGYVTYWLMPATVAESTVAGYENMQSGSLIGILAYGAGWLLSSVVILSSALGFLRSELSWRRDRPYSTSRVIRLGLYGFGLTAIAGYLPFTTVDLALEHVIPSPQREHVGSHLGPIFGAAIVALLLAIVLSLLNFAFRGARDPITVPGTQPEEQMSP